MSIEFKTNSEFEEQLFEISIILEHKLKDFMLRTPFKMKCLRCFYMGI